MTSPAPPVSGLVTGEAVSLDLEPGQLASRLVAAVIDLLAEYGGLLALLLVLSLVLGPVDVDVALVAAIVVLLVALCLLGYPVLMLTFTRGRTLGKMAMGLRVVRDDGGPVAFRQALVRELVGLVVEKPGPLLGLPAVVVSLLREDGRRVGDLAAGTRVVRERVAVTGTGGYPLPMPPALAGWAAALDLSRLSDRQALVARDFLARSGTLRPEARERVGGSVVAGVATAVGATPAGVPGWVFLAAVLAERRRRDELRLAERSSLAARPPGVAGPQQQWERFYAGQPVVVSPRAAGTAAYDAPLVGF